MRAWDFSDGEKRMLLAPAMNTCMWESPFTRRHLDTLLELGGDGKKNGNGGGGGGGVGGGGGGRGGPLRKVMKFWGIATRSLVPIFGGGSGSGGTVSVIDPVEKTLACGDVGNGAMASVGTIVAAVALHAGQLTLDADL